MWVEGCRTSVASGFIALHPDISTADNVRITGLESTDPPADPNAPDLGNLEDGDWESEGTDIEPQSSTTTESPGSSTLPAKPIATKPRVEPNKTNATVPNK